MLTGMFQAPASARTWLKPPSCFRKLATADTERAALASAICTLPVRASLAIFHEPVTDSVELAAMGMRRLVGDDSTGAFAQCVAAGLNDILL